MIRFVHTADIHFGMENYGKIDPETGIHTRLLDFERALTSCIDYAIEHQVDFFLFSGDAYKTAHPSPTQQRLLLNCFLRLYQAHIPVIIIVGNHDHPLSFGKAHALDIFSALPVDGFTVIAKPQTLQLSTKHGPINIVGIPWPSRTTIALQGAYIAKSAQELTQMISDAVAHIIQTHALQLDPKIPAVLAGHLTVSSGIFSGSEKRAIYGNDPVLLPSQLAIPPFDYVGLGHLHRYQDLNPHGYPAIVYSGSIERIDFGERKDTKGFCVVTIPEKDKATHEFIPVPTRPFIQLEVTLTADKNHTQQILDALNNHTLDGAVVKILYHVPAGIKDAVDTTLILKACSAAQHVVGIFPERTIEHKDRRMTVTQELSLEQLYTHYFNSKQSLQPRSKELTQKVLALYESIVSQADEKTGP